MSTRTKVRRIGIAAFMLLAPLLLACADRSIPSSNQSVPAVTATPAPLTTYVVQRGDRLVDIAAEYDISLSRLLEWNDIPDPDVIEVGDVINLEDPATVRPQASASAPIPEATALPRLIQPEEVSPSLNDRVRDWWSNAPRPSLSSDAVRQGVIAAVALPLTVVGLLLLWLGARGARGVFRRVRAGADVTADGTADEVPTAGSVDTATQDDQMSRIGGALRAVRASLANLVNGTRRGLAAGGRSISSVGYRVATAIGTGVAAAAGRIGHVLHLGARRAADAHAARRDRQRDAEIRRESRRWWSQGRERLRIGLLDEAEEAFETGLRLSVEGGWKEEIDLYREELKLLQERRSVERSLVPSVPKP